METKIIKTVILLILSIALLTVIFNYFSKLSDTVLQLGLAIAALAVIYFTYKFLKTIIRS